MSKATITKKPTRPQRDEFELEELGNQLIEAHAEGTEVILTVWKKEEPVRGKIVELDGITKLIHVSHYGEKWKIPFLDILKVDYPEY